MKTYLTEAHAVCLLQPNPRIDPEGPQIVKKLIEHVRKHSLQNLQRLKNVQTAQAKFKRLRKHQRKRRKPKR